MEGKHQNQFRCFPPTGSPLKKEETTPSSRGKLSFKKMVHALLSTFCNVNNKQTQRHTVEKKKNTLIPKKAQNCSKPTAQAIKLFTPEETNLGLTHFLPNHLSQLQLVTSISLTTFLCCHSPSTVVSGKQPGLMHFLAQQMAIWPLKTTLASSQSSRNRDTFSDQCCPTFNARGSTLCSRQSRRGLHFRTIIRHRSPVQTFWATVPPHVSYIRRLTTA